MEIQFERERRVMKVLGERDQWAVLCALVQKLTENGSWTGQTHIQKATYLLKELAGVPLQFKFRLCHHGPYSFDLNGEIDFLRERKVLKATAQEPYGLRFQVAENVATGTEMKYQRQLEFIGRAVGRKNVVELEALSTALLVTKECPNSSLVDRQTRLQEIKPHLKNEMVAKAFSELTRLREQAQALGGNHELAAPLLPGRDNGRQH